MSEYIITGEQLERLEIPDMFTEQEIVRCRDCKHYEYWKFRDGRTAHDCARGGDYLFDTEPDGFCKWAERRDA